MIIKGWEISKKAYLFYILYSIVVDEALHGIGWYDPLMVVVFNLLPIYICVDHVQEVKLMNIWAFAYDDTMWSLCIFSYSSSDFVSMCTSMLEWSIGSAIDELKIVK